MQKCNLKYFFLSLSEIFYTGPTSTNLNPTLIFAQESHTYSQALSAIPLQRVCKDRVGLLFRWIQVLLRPDSACLECVTHQCCLLFGKHLLCLVGCQYLLILPFHSFPPFHPPPVETRLSVRVMCLQSGPEKIPIYIGI